ncbi:MAG: hypothetical protein ABS79_08010 [Planctomycetes bacterium SCN 63-9]|nr:MAG: hypothetical protein ABS79_08010 [Planctomycetes bacterium SCN 63-9]
MLILEAHSARSGEEGSPPTQWPATTELVLDRAKPTLLIFVHPRCPCSRASVAELSQVLSRGGGRISVHAVIYRPKQAPEGWSRADLGIEQSLASLSMVEVHDDLEGREARCFGVSTSGHVLLFDPAGRRIFEGGITASRGHEGENRGCEEVIALIQGSGETRENLARSAPPVFGCPIVTPKTPFGETD